MLDDIETGAPSALSEDNRPFSHFCPEHVLLDVVDLLFRQIVKYEMVLERGQNELLVDLGLGLPHGLDALISHPKPHFVESDELVLLG